MLLRDLSHFRLSITKLHIKKLDGTASLALSEGVVDKEEVSNNNNNDDQSLAKAVWRSLNPSDEEQPILTAMDMRIDPLDRHKQGLLARSRLTQSTKSIAPPTFAWVRNAEGEPAGNFLTEQEATEGEFDELESGLAWI